MTDLLIVQEYTAGIKSAVLFLLKMLRLSLLFIFRWTGVALAFMLGAVGVLMAFFWYALGFVSSASYSAFKSGWEGFEDCPGIWQQVNNSRFMKVLKGE